MFNKTIYKTNVELHFKYNCRTSEICKDNLKISPSSNKSHVCLGNREIIRAFCILK